jgi:RimJ/RimL family protein N-acetyltransferase
VSGTGGSEVETWWADVLHVPVTELWRPGLRLVRAPASETRLTVVRRHDATYVVLPRWVDAATESGLARQDPDELLTRSFWKPLAKAHDRTAEHPTIHMFTVTPIEPGRGVSEIEPAEVAAWQDDVKPEKWRLSGFGFDVLAAYGVRDERGTLAAASNLTRDRGSPPMVGVLTHPAHRGRGFASRAVRAATSASVEADGLAGLRARLDDDRGRSIGASLGFETYCEELVVR